MLAPSRAYRACLGFADAPPIHLAQIEFAEHLQIPLAVLLGVRAALDPIELAGQGVVQDRVVEDGINWSKVDFDYTNADIPDNYYQHPVLDAVLQKYACHLNDTYVQFPIGGLRGFRCQVAIV